MKTVKTDGAVIHYRDDGITHIIYDNTLLNLATVTSIFLENRRTSPWEVSPIFASGYTFTNLEKEASSFLSSEEVLKHCSGLAILSKTLGEKITANFFINFNKPSKPTKFFSTEEEAIKWLKQFETINKK